MPSRASSNPYAVSSPDGLAPAYHAPARPNAAAPSPTTAEALPSARASAEEPPQAGAADLDTMTLPPQAAVGWSPTSWRRAMSTSSRG